MNVAKRPPKNNENANNGMYGKQGKSSLPPQFTADTMVGGQISGPQGGDKPRKSSGTPGGPSAGMGGSAKGTPEGY